MQAWLMAATRVCGDADCMRDLSVRHHSLFFLSLRLGLLPPVRAYQKPAPDSQVLTIVPFELPGILWHRAHLSS